VFLTGILIQLGWCVVFLFLGQHLFRKGVRQYAGFGA